MEDSSIKLELETENSADSWSSSAASDELNFDSEIDELASARGGIFDIRSLTISPIEPPSPASTNNSKNFNENSLQQQSIENFFNQNKSIDSMTGNEIVISLSEINAQISPPKDLNRNYDNDSKNLETIYEGLYFETPPKLRNPQNLVKENNSNIKSLKNTVITEYFMKSKKTNS